VGSKPPLANAGRFTGATDRVAVVVNGNARQVTGELVDTLDQIVQSGDLFVSRSLEEGQDIARTIVERGYPTVLTGGGDGTFVQMVTWVARIAGELERPLPRFGLLRLGTGNALAWVLGAQSKQNKHAKGVVADLARLRREGGSRLLRLLDVEGLLTPFAGLGADAIALEHHHRTREQLDAVKWLKPLASPAVTYALSIATRSVPHYLFGRMPSFRVINNGSPASRMGQDGRPVGRDVKHGETIYEGPATILAFSTIPYWGLGARAFPYADEREDRFSLRVVNFGSLEVVTHIKEIWDGSYRSDRLHDFLVDDVIIECDTPTPLEVGGDVVGMRERTSAKLSTLPVRVVDYYSPPANVS
jgi:diacylglycerol kinase family enzyme